VKGSPEWIIELCDKNTIPDDFDPVLEQYTSQGLWVIALSYKEIPNAKDEEIVNYERDQVEKNLKFLGLLIFVNKIKEKTF